MANDEAILNWKNDLRPDNKGEVEDVTRLFDQKIDDGMSIDSAVEIVVACGHPLDVVKRVAEKRRLEVEAEQGIASNANETETQQQTFPVSYADVQGNVARIATSMEADDALALLAGATNNAPGLIRTTNKERTKFKNVLAKAKRGRDPVSVSNVHKWAGPHIETAIHDSEVLAQCLADDDDIIVTAGDAPQKYEICEKDGESYDVDLSAMTCTCPRYVFGSFAHVGLACEHILYAAAMNEDE